MPTCGSTGCGRTAGYQFRSGAATDSRCLRHALVYPPVSGRALRVAAVVGTILFVINQADVVLGGQLSALTIAKIGLTYVVPYSVSTYSAIAANRLRSRDPSSATPTWR